jgi:hypothetical protein
MENIEDLRKNPINKIRLAINHLRYLSRNHRKTTLDRKLDRKTTLKIRCFDLQQAEHLKEEAKTLEDWFIESDIRIKWSWKHFCFVYTFKIFKNPT